MPPEPQAGSKILPWNGSMISTIKRTIEVGVKNSPPLLSLGHCELAKEVLVNQPERVTVQRGPEAV